jgi:hypothetical protein
MGLRKDWDEEVSPHKCEKWRNYSQYEREPIIENSHKEG